MARRHVVQTVVASVVTGVTASAVTWYLTKKAFEEAYETRLLQEVEASITFLMSQGVDFSKVDVVDEIPEQDPEAPDSVPPVSEILDEGFDTPVLESVEGERIFPDQTEKPPLDDLAKQRVRYDKIMTENEYKEPEPEAAPENPDISVISVDLYNSNVSEFEQTTLTIFADGGVIDISGDLVLEHTELIGLPPYPFGEMSEDPDAVYIRNKKLEREFEVLRDGGNAAEFLAHSLQTKFSPGF